MLGDECVTFPTPLRNIGLENKEVEPSKTKIKMVIKLLKNNEVAEKDRICGELLKLRGPSLTDEIFSIIPRIWHTKEIPVEWRTYIISYLSNIKKTGP